MPNLRSLYFDNLQYKLFKELIVFFIVLFQFSFTDKFHKYINVQS